MIGMIVVLGEMDVARMHIPGCKGQRTPCTKRLGRINPANDGRLLPGEEGPEEPGGGGGGLKLPLPP